MPPLPDVTSTLQDGALGIVPANVGQLQVKFGVSSLGLVNTLYAFSRTQDVGPALGTGPLVEAGAHTLGVAGGPVYFVPVNASVAATSGPSWLSGAGAAKTSANGAGAALVWSYQPSAGAATNSAVTQTGSGPAVTLTGTTTVNAGILVTIVTGGILATSTFTYSLDGGVTSSGVIATAATYLIPGTGVTLNFAAGTYIVGTTYAATIVLHAAVGTGTIVPSGTPLAASAGTTPSNLLNGIGAYDVIVTIVVGGAIGTATFNYSLDGGQTVNSGTITSAATYLIPNTGITLTFTGTFSAGDKYQFLSVAQSGAGVGSIIATGAPLDTYQVQVKITASALNLAANVGTFQISLDQGNTFSPVLAIPVSGVYAVPNSGITVTFYNGLIGQAAQGTGNAFVAGDVYLFDTVGPGYTAGDLTTAWNAFLATGTSVGMAHVVGAPTTAAAEATLAASVEALLASADTNQFKPMVGILDGADDTDANFQTQFASAADPHLMIPAGFCALVSPISGRIYKRPAAWALASRASKKPISEDLGRVRSGSIEGVKALYRDEFITPALDAQRFATLRTIVGLTGFYCTNGNMMAAVGSDFNSIQRRQVINTAIIIGRAALLTFLGDSTRVNATTGFIDERDARAIENFVTAQINTALLQPGHISAVTCQVTRNDNLLSSSTIRVKLLLTPLGYAKFIALSLGYFNPALIVKSN